MSRKSKYSVDEKVRAVQKYLDGKGSKDSVAKELDITRQSFEQWVKNYEAMGIDAFITHHNKHYSKPEKELAVTAYLAGEGSLMDICKKFKIHSTSILRKWIKKYNSHEELKASGKGDTTIMTKGRTTTFDERVEIASYCIAHDHNYSKTAEKYNVSYQQARNYTVKYEKNGIQGLQDKRGKRKTEDELSEIEKLRAELKMEKAKRIKAEMEASFLKKLDEIERRRG